MAPGISAWGLFYYKEFIEIECSLNYAHIIIAKTACFSLQCIKKELGYI